MNDGAITFPGDREVYIPLGQYKICRDPAPFLTYAEVPLLFGDGEHDDTLAIQWAIDGKPVRCAHCLKIINFSDIGNQLAGSCPGKHHAVHEE